MKMAAKAIDIQSKKRTSKRILAANKFLSNISLDGKVPASKEKEKKPKTKPSTSLDKEEIQLISNQNFVHPVLLARPNLLSSFSTTEALNESKKLGLGCTSTFNFSGAEHAAYSRALSLRDSKCLQNNIVYVAARNLTTKSAELCGKRVVLCSGHHVPFAVYSTLKYTQQKICADSLDKSTYKLKRLSGEDEQISCSIKGIDIGSKDKPVSYGHLLERASAATQLSRNVLSPWKPAALSASPTLEENRIAATPNSNMPSKMSFRDYYHANSYGDWNDYDPYYLDNPELRSGRHRKVLKLSSFMVSIIEYVKPSQLKKDLNEQFKEKFPTLEITLSKLRSLKQDIVKLANECSLDFSTVAYTTVYFEKLVLWGKISKANRKLVVGSCLLLAAKFNSDLKKDAVKQLIDHISDWFKVNTKDLLMFEIQALIAMEFNLHAPMAHVLPHIKRFKFENTAAM